ncbi:MAG: flagellar M-ring protein FliF [Sulfurospirillaceae bacterium]|nr:flagellar M-ring protein FliF [Sulfurospirillaceae bacterium]MCK9545468.1 flagellar M-ring protein FliF [Sulfurospirillaceae bacterium]
MDIKTLFHQIGTLFQNLSLRQRIVAGLSVSIAVGFLVFLSFYKGGSSEGYGGYSALFENTTPEDSALIIQQLEQRKVPYKVYNESTVLVPNDVVYKERITIAALGIPKNSKVGYEIFDKSEFGATDFAQQIKYLRALEGELARTIESLQPINRANVHIAIPKDSVFTQRQASPTASVVLEINPSMHLQSKQISGIKNLVSSSVSKMQPEDVKIVNQNGVPLGEEEGVYEDELIQKQVKYKRGYESDYEQKIINVLAPIIGGVDKVVAKVNIDFDFSQKESTSEEFDPESVPRSEQSIEEAREGRRPAEVGGVPGAVSNIGPVEGIENDRLEEKYNKNSITTNYEISKRVTNVKGEFATIKRVSAAVVVDGKYELNEDKKLEFIALAPEQLASIESIVKQTVGFNETRGDEVAVSNFEFKPLQADGKVAPTKTFVSLAHYYLEPIWPLLKYIFVAIILFIFYKKIIIPFSVRMLEARQEESEDIEKFKEELEEEEESAEDTLEKFRQARKKVEEQLGIGEDFDEEELRYDVLLEKLKTMVNDRGEDVASLLQGMIKSETEFGTPYGKGD